MTPTLTPTFAPTLSNALTQEDISIWFNYFMGCTLLMIVILTFIGIADAKLIRKNQLSRWSALLGFAFYFIDFVSDVFFSMKLFFVYGE